MLPIQYNASAINNTNTFGKRAVRWGALRLECAMSFFAMSGVFHTLEGDLNMYII